MEVHSLEIPEVKLIVPRIHLDARGFLSETFSRRGLQAAGIVADFVQDNHSLSIEAGTVRGLHFQAPPHAQGKLVMAGPFTDGAAARGIVVYRVKDVAEAKALAADDPAVKAGRLVLEAYPWMTFKGILK